MSSAAAESADQLVRWGGTTDPFADRRRGPCRLLDGGGRADAGAEGPAGAPTEPDDAALVARLTAGDDAALATLYDRHAPVVFARALAIVEDRSAAEGILREAFFRLWAHPASPAALRLPVTVRLLDLARDLALTEVRAGLQRRPASPENGAGSVGLTPADAPAGVACAGWPADQRRALELAHIGGLREREIAELMDTTAGRIRRLLRLAFARLRQPGAEFPPGCASDEHGTHTAILSGSDPIDAECDP